MKILVIGSGAREHAIVWKLLQSRNIERIFVAPGNAGTAQIASNLQINATDIISLIAAAHQNKVDFTFVGPETPLADGIVDEFQKAGLPIFGPSSASARIEASKIFSKDLMHRYGVPTSQSRSFSSFDEASVYMKQQTPPIVLKADGLAAGKGVVIAQSVEEALSSLKSMMQDKAFGVAGEKVVVEEYLTGREMSVFVFTDGKTLSPPVTACDYKRVFDGNQGPNTGGMGSFSPPDFYTEELGERAMREIMRPTIKALAAEGAPYSGVLYGGLMITSNGTKTIEFNCRLGDPETQVILPRLETDLTEIALAVVEKKLDRQKIQWSKKTCVGVVMASGGYPGHYETGFPINGLENVDPNVMVFHAGTKLDSSGRVVTAGGRVLTVVATGETLAQARQKVYNNISRIDFKGAHYRKDIAAF
ncbi:MAG: phosphoribosylamine--glycine ligase [Dehalococcoidia bacterium]|nr:MAG: phosphoribosylamine--glycine ligase [Dehalococcoidia bacterium]